MAPVVLPEGDLGYVDARVLALEWSADALYVSLVIKTSASFDHDPLSGRVPAFWVAPPKLDAADVVPAKRACDVNVVGSLRILPLPSGYTGAQRGLRLTVGDALDIRAFLDARHSGAVPLVPGLLVDAGGAPGFTLGPSAPPDRARALSGELELEACQLAPPSRRVPFDEPIDSMELEGFFEAPEPVEIALPVLTPRVLVDRRGTGSELTEEPTVLDTLTVDLDRRAVDMVWRCVFRGRLDGIGRVILGFGLDLPEEAEARWIKLLAELPRGRFSLSYAVEDVDAGVDPPELDEPSLAMAKLEAWESPMGPTPTISLEAYAAVTAELLEGRDTRVMVLAKHGLDEERFAIEEKAWASQLSEVPEEEPSLASELGVLIIEAQDALAHPAEDALGIPEYALLYAHMERREPTRVLAEHMLLDLGDGRPKRPLSQAAFMRLERKVDRLLEEDPGRQAELDREIERIAATLPETMIEDSFPQEVKDALLEAEREEAGSSKEDTKEPGAT
jgi:hypothetical protein